MNVSPKKLYAIRYSLYATSGFTLLEALFVIVLLTTSAGIGIVAFSSLYRQSDMESAESAIVVSLRLAQSKAAAGDTDSDWGVYFEPQSAIVFQGDNYALRDPSFDQTADIAPGVLVSGFGEIIFSRPVGTTTNTGTITLTSDGQPSRDIIINSFGMVEY